MRRSMCVRVLREKMENTAEVVRGVLDRIWDTVARFPGSIVQMAWLGSRLSTKQGSVHFPDLSSMDYPSYFCGFTGTLQPAWPSEFTPPSQILLTLYSSALALNIETWIQVLMDYLFLWVTTYVVTIKEFPDLFLKRTSFMNMLQADALNHEKCLCNLTILKLVLSLTNCYI